jgi:hypothetical protein
LRENDVPFVGESFREGQDLRRREVVGQERKD